MKFHSLLLGVSAGTLGFSGVAATQETSSEPAASSKVVLEEVFVTAERRSESLQKTPISASVLTGDDLTRLGVNVVDQLQFISPSAVINNFGQGIDFNIRGIGKAEHNTQTMTGVITYRDNVATFPGYFTREPYYDIARVEILRGPQGTFVGENATGGAVFVTSNDPVIGGGHDGYLQGQVGNFNDFGLQGAVNLPINDTLAARFAFHGETRDSFYNISGPWTGGDGALDMGSARVGLSWKPNDAWSVLFKADYNYIDMGAFPADPVNSTNDIFDITANGEMRALDRFGRATLKVDYLYPNGTAFRSVTGYQDGNTEYRADLDGTSVGINNFRDAVDETIFSQEFNLISSDTGPTKWVVGAYYQSDEYNFLPGEFVIDTPPVAYILDGTNPKWAVAGFGQISFDLPADFQIQLGARYTESRTTNHVNINQFGLPLVDEQTAKFTNWSGKLALNWTANDQNFLYAFVATGYKPGGLNVPVGLGLPAPFIEEEVTSYEIGWKSEMSDGHVRTQVDAYYNDYDNFQVIIGYPAFPVFGFELNNPSTTEIYGFEAQIEAAFGGFSLNIGAGVNHSALGSFFATDPRAASLTPCDPATGPASASCIDLTNHKQTYAPELTVNVGAQYEFTLGGGDTLAPRVDFGHVSTQWATLFENVARGDRIEARDIWNAQVAWRHGSYIATLYGTNLSDKHYVAAINSGLRLAGMPRQFGLRVMKSF